jgi:signal transduction histidine kinase
MAKFGLRSRLFFSHVIVMLVGVVTLTVIGKISSPRFFVFYLESIEVQGIRIQQIRKELVRGFELAWSRGAVWSILSGVSAAAGLSYLVTQRIVRPLVHMEEITKKFASGQLEERVPNSEIPELDQLASSFNRMAAGLEGVENRRRELVSDLTHELRTPLTVLKGYLEGLADGTIEASPTVYQILTKEAARMQRLVNDVQELSKMEAGYLPIDARPFDLHPLLESLIRRFSDQLVLQNSPVMQLKYPPDIPMVLADPERVEQVLVNLLSNALRYTPEGSITLQVWREAHQVWVAVIDTGTGIAAEDLLNVFERFWRADRSRDRNSGGSGLGLAICRRLIEVQGGSIQVESQVGQGTTFKFSLPLVT